MSWTRSYIRKSLWRGQGGGGGDEDIEGLQKFLDTRREGSEKIVGLEEGLWKFVEWFSTEQFNDLCNSAISRGL